MLILALRLDFLFHQPHSFSAGPKKEKKDKDKKKGDKENGAGGEGNNDVEDKLAQKTKHRQTILKVTNVTTKITCD